MAPRIEKIWGSIFGQTTVKRKDSPLRDGATSQQDAQDGSKRSDSQNQEQSTHDEPKKQPVDRVTLEKAVTELRAAQDFTQTGLVIEVVESGGVFYVRFVHSNGTIVKMLNADEFILQKMVSSPEHTPRGKILDQKF